MRKYAAAEPAKSSPETKSNKHIYIYIYINPASRGDLRERVYVYVCSIYIPSIPRRPQGKGVCICYVVYIYIYPASRGDLRERVYVL